MVETTVSSPLSAPCALRQRASSRAACPIVARGKVSGGGKPARENSRTVGLKRSRMVVCWLFGPCFVPPGENSGSHSAFVHWPHALTKVTPAQVARAARSAATSQLARCSQFPKTLNRNPQVPRSARASATSKNLRETRSKTHDAKGKLTHAIARLRVLAYRKHAASPLASLAAPWHGQVTRASKPATVPNNHRAPKSPSFLKRLRNQISFDARLVSIWLSLFSTSGRRSRCYVEPRGPVIDHLRLLDPADRRDP